MARLFQLMNVTTGTRLGPYEIVARLGAGGMGEVWSAVDTRLDRRVAVKILPAELARDAEFRLRFEREARTISQLSHPNICTLFDVGDGFLVMELLEGETLADRLVRGPLPMADVLRYGMQVAEALGKAHRMGIVHRDLKPANVMLTKTGAKLLDFGLAKASAGVVDVDGATQHKPLTREGTILGTFQYMAPEQLEGIEADARTDIFALGALLYEMATGHRAFEGKTKTSLIAQIVSAEPRPLREVVPLTPPAFEHVVSRCLSKDPEQRWQSAQDIAEQLRWAGTAATDVASKKPSRLAWLRWAIPSLVAVIAIAALAMALRRAAPERVVWSDISAPEGVRILGPNERGASVLSPDGNLIVIGAQDKSGVVRLYLRSLRNGDMRPLADTNGAILPFWSPDSKSVGFFADGALKRIDLDSSRSAVIARGVDGRGGAWGPDGTIVFAASSTSGLSRVRATGGDPVLFTKFHGDQVSHRFPSFLPDGKHVLYMAQGTRDRGIHVAAVDGGMNRRLVENMTSGIFFDGKWILYLRDGALYAQEADPEKLELRGDPRQLAAAVSSKENAFSFSGISASSMGDVLFPSVSSLANAAVSRDRGGAVIRSAGGERSLSEPAFSPDETKIVAGSDEPPGSLWEIDLERGRSRRILNGDGAATTSWSRDGRRFVMQTSSDGKPVLGMMPAGGGALEVLVATPVALFPESFSPGDELLVLDGPGPSGKDFDLWMLDLSSRKVTPLLSTPANEGRLQFSPDGRFVSYSSDETGRPEVFVRRWPITEEKWQVTLNGGDQAFWIRGGKELVYLAPDGKLMSVSVQAGAEIASGDPVLLFQTPLTPTSMTGNRNQYLATRDGERFVLMEPVESTPARLTLVQGLGTLLK